MKRRSLPVLALALPVMVLAAAPLLFWVRKLGGGTWAVLLLFAVWVGVPAALPLSHLFRGEKIRIGLHLAAEAWLALALYLWISAALAWLLWLPLRGNRWEIPCACLFCGAFLLLFAGGMVNAAFLRTRRYRVDVGLEQPLRVALLSDLHLGFFTTRGMLRRIVRLTEREEPELVLFAGDFFDMDYDSLRHKAECAAMLRRVRGTLGTFGCLGNHDHYLKDDRKDTFLREAGVSILQDEAASVGGLTIFGRRDVQNPLREAWDPVRTAGRRPLLVLDHNPASYREYIGSADVLLCGHTHGGQTFPLDLLQKALLKYPVSGLHKYGGLKTVVTSGAGFWGPPVRFGVSNEVIILTIF